MLPWWHCNSFLYHFQHFLPLLDLENTVCTGILWLYLNTMQQELCSGVYQHTGNATGLCSCRWHVFYSHPVEKKNLTQKVAPRLKTLKNTLKGEDIDVIHKDLFSKNPLSLLRSRLRKAASTSSSNMMLCSGATVSRWFRRSSDRPFSLRFRTQML